MACHIQFIPVFLTFSCLAYAEREKEEMGEIWFMRLDIEIRGVLKIIIFKTMSSSNKFETPLKTKLVCTNLQHVQSIASVEKSIGWLAGWFVSWLVGWLDGWLGGLFVVVS